MGRRRRDTPSRGDIDTIGSFIPGRTIRTAQGPHGLAGGQAGRQADPVTAVIMMMMMMMGGASCPCRAESPKGAPVSREKHVTG